MTFPNEKIERGFKKAVKQFGKENIIIQSEYKEHIYEEYYKKDLDKTFPGIKVITAGKGLRYGSRPYNFARLESHLDELHPKKDYQLNKMAFIGDRLFDDVVYANKNQMVSIWLREEFKKEDILR